MMWLPGAMVRYLFDRLTLPDEREMRLLATWPSQVKTTVPVGEGLLGATFAVKVNEAPGATVAVERESVVVLETRLEPVTLTVIAEEIEEP